ncbi:hypothetical protein ACLQ2Y_27470 [Micromonospora echinospora]|uniref:hypothetical protein n=1 Tax=Micromonospora echinospora TaxID=1877 RepID=UPI003CEB488F
MLLTLIGVVVPRYGYRLFTVKLRAGSRHADLDFGNLRESHFLDVLKPDLASRLSENVKLPDPPKITEDGSQVPPSGNVIRYTQVDRASNNLKFKFLYGTYGEDGTLIDPDGVNGDQDITNLAVTNPYRSVLVTPASGFVALLAVEVRGRTCPYRRVIKGFEVIGNGRYRLKVEEGIADQAAVADFIRNGIVKELEVVRYSRATDDDPVVDDITLKVGISGGSSLQASLRQRALDWWQRRRNRDSEAADLGQLANELAAIAVGARIPVEFEDSVLRVEGENQRSKSLRPAQDITEWIYDLGASPVSDDSFYRQVTDTAEVLLPNIGLGSDVAPQE